MQTGGGDTLFFYCLKDRGGSMSGLEIDMEFLIQESFLGYKYRKENKKLYTTDADLPKKLIYLYYSTNQNRNFEDIPRAFINRYIKNECALEGVHEKAEVIGQGIMYEFAHTTDERFDIYSLLSFHKQLYSAAEFPEYGGNFRNFDVYLPGTGTELAEWSMIRSRIKALDSVVNELIERASTLDKSNPRMLFEYIEDCIKIKCALIKIHPFFDGNGRTIRCFINHLFELASIPPIYIKVNERTEYHVAMNKANCENDFNSIINFYCYKICDSIIELDINNRIKNEKGRQKINNMGTAKNISGGN